MATPYQTGGYCRCPACRSRSLMGPIVLITLGILFMLQMTSWRFPFRDTWPVLLVVIGAVQILQRLMPATGHRGVTDLTPPPPPNVPRPR